MANQKKHRWLPYLMVLPAFSIMVLVVVFPIVNTVARSFRTADGQFTLDNYLRLLDPTFLKILWESLWLAFMSTLACLLVGYPFAYRIAPASAKMKPWLLLLVIIPNWTNSLIRT